MTRVYILFFSIFILSCNTGEKDPEVTLTNSDEISISKTQFETSNMKFGTLEPHEFQLAVQTNGEIDVPPGNKASVNSFVEGYVDEIPFIIGDRVTKGQFIARLTHTDYIAIQQDYLSVFAQLAFLKNEYERQEKLFEAQISSQKNFLKAESDYKSAYAKCRGLEKKLQMMHIDPKEVQKGNLTETISLYAPISGFVTEVNASKGSFVSSATKLIQIINTDHIHLELNVFEKDILKIQKDQEILFRIPEASEKRFKAKVYLVGTHIDEDRTVKVHGHIEDDSVNFISGMFVEAGIVYHQKTAWALPNEALFSDNGKPYVLLRKEVTDSDYIFEKKWVTIIEVDDSHTSIEKPNLLKDKELLLKSNFMF